jgi:predicted TIM-barrel fold metal-dependent hydrolase
MTNGMKVISADSHVIEPPDLWQKYLPAKFRERAPHLIHAETTDLIVCEGEELAPVGLLAGCYRQGEDVRLEGRWDEDVPDSGYDPDARVTAIDKDGVSGEILFPTLGMHVFPIKDTEFQWSLFRAYNDWLSDFCGSYPDRFKGLAMLMHENVETSVAELERAAAKGLSGVMVPLWTGEDNPYHDGRFDPIWRAAVDHGMPVNMHTSTTRDKSRAWNKGGAVDNWVLKTSQIQHAILEMIFFGLFDRFPDLTVVSAENDAGWAGNVIERADFWWRRNRKVYAGGDSVVCEHEPSYYFRKNIKMTFMRDRTAILAREVIGTESLMWGSDFPHHVSTWPDTLSTLADYFEGVPDDVRDAIVSRNVQELYKF